MAITTYEYIGWGEEHTLYLNHLYALYHSEIAWERQLCDIGYIGHPDPIFEDESSTYTPDFVAYGSEGDVQHIDVKGFEYIESHFDGEEEDICDKIAESISDLTKYREITDDMVVEYFEGRGHSVEPSHHEVVALLPYEIYDSYKATVEDAVRESDLILWLIRTNGESKIWKAVGTHSTTGLNEELNSKLRVYPATDLVQFTRQTRTSIKKYKFTEKLLKYCAREQKRTFKFEEVDDVMTQTRPPLLGHIPQEEREETWTEYVYSLLHHLELIEHGEGENEYRWKKSRFLTEPRDQHQILKEAWNGLGLGN